jgi:DNA-binding CsgD family transcriptional regulator
LQLLQSLFSLTKAEAEVADSLRSGLNIAAIPGMRKVSVETVRSQLKSLMSKTKIRRQSDLVRLLNMA